MAAQPIRMIDTDHTSEKPRFFRVVPETHRAANFSSTMTDVLGMALSASGLTGHTAPVCPRTNHHFHPF